LNARPVFLLATAACALLAAPGAGAMSIFAGGGSARIEGSGRVVEQARPLPAFRTLVVDGPVDVVLRAGAQERAVVRADDNIVPLILTAVSGGRLTVGLRPQAQLRTRTRMVVTVDFTRLDAVTILGSGDVQADAVRTDVLELVLRGSGDAAVDRVEAGAVAISISGSGDVTLRAGRADTVGVVIEGSGDARLAGVQARAGAVRIRGSGDVTIHAAEALEVDITGSGDVRYRGEPALTKRVAGSGSVRPLR
jgi:hypothetical protein